MKILKHPIFYISMLVAFAIYIAQKFVLPLPNWVYFYVNDFLCMPIVLSLCLATIRIIKRTESLYVPLLIVLILTTYFTLYFEWLMPKLNTRYTFDKFDIVLYYLGALLFFRYQKILF